MMRVVMLTSVESKCGVADYSRDLVKELSKQIDVTVAPIPKVTDRDDCRRCLSEINGGGDLVHIQYHPDFFGYWRTPRRALAFAKFLRSIRIPLVMTIHDFYSPRRMGGAPGIRGIGRLAIQSFIDHTSVGRSLHIGFLKHAKRLIVHSVGMQERLSKYGVLTSQLHVLYPGIPALSKPFRESLREKLSIASGSRIVTVFGFVRPHKGIECVLQAVSRLPQTVFVIAGGAPDRPCELYLDSLWEMSRAIGVSDRLRVTGFLGAEEVAATLLESDVIVLPYPEGVTSASYALSYAAAAERPLVVSDTQYFRERQRDCDAFDVFPAGDAEALASVIAQVLGRRSQRPGAEKFRVEGSWARTAARTARIYREALGQVTADQSVSK